MRQNPPALLRIHARDTVAVALEPLEPGQTLLGVTLQEAIPRGHKVALQPHTQDQAVIKYGLPIGRACRHIAAGEHVHSHNLQTALSGECRYRRDQSPAVVTPPPAAPDSMATWQGYVRDDGRAATRNEIWILPTVGCVGITAETIARTAQARHRGRIDGIHAFSHPHGCSQLGDDLAGTRSLLAGLAANPNAAGVLLLGLGCESNQLDALLEAVDDAARPKIRVLSSQSVGDELAVAQSLIDELVDAAATASRRTMPLSALTVGLKCGGSDAFSGLTANPLLGRFTDALTMAGGQAILTEIPEIFGAEQALLDRATQAAVFDRASALINRFKRYYLDQGLPVSENPSPGNLAGGITTLEEKSLGAVQKGGNAPLVDVIDYGRPVTRAGLTLLEAPGNDAVSTSALAAAGATLALFTTGRGTPLGFPVPTLKIASNRTLAETKPHWIDYDASIALDTGPGAADEGLLKQVLAVASGSPCTAERSDQRAIAIWKRGVTL